ncbi:MAG TPA: hypothetical protein VJ915_06870 [Balneolaceae bacterium]|nr:hypothetical protein [Balneolaceae bacterium]
MKVIQSKIPYLILLVIFFFIATTDTLLWSEKVEPMVVEVETTEEVTNSTNESFLKFAFKNGDD